MGGDAGEFGVNYVIGYHAVGMAERTDGYFMSMSCSLSSFPGVGTLWIL